MNQWELSKQLARDAERIVDDYEKIRHLIDGLHMCIESKTRDLLKQVQALHNEHKPSGVNLSPFADEEIDEATSLSR
jgi:hypothetical protein